MWRTIGIIGAGRGTGVTHLAVWMANYLAGGRRERVAVLEWNHHGDIRRMVRFCGGKPCREADAGEEPSKGQSSKGKSSKGKSSKGQSSKAQPGGGNCRILEVDYYGQAGAAQLASCLNGNYHRIIVDYGEITDTSLWECARCDRKIIVGALSEWRAEAFLEAAGSGGGRDKSWSYVAAFGSEEARRELEKAFGLRCLRIPASADAFAVTRTDMDFFEMLLF